MHVEGLLRIQLCAGQAGGGVTQTVSDAGPVWQACGGKTTGHVTCQRLPDVREWPLPWVLVPALSFPG